MLGARDMYLINGNHAPTKSAASDRPHNFTISNPDAQKTTQPCQIFRVDEIKITSVDNTLRLVGECFDEMLKIQYAQVGGQPTTPTTPITTNKTYTGAVTGLKKGDNVEVTVADNAGVVVKQTVSVE